MVNFDQPSYSVMEGDDAVIVSITLSQSSSMNIEVDINTMDVTATGILIHLLELLIIFLYYRCRRL